MFYKTILSFVIIILSTTATFSNETIFNGNFVQGGIIIGPVSYTHIRAHET